MVDALSVAVEFLYRREPLPGSKVWSLNRLKYPGVSSGRDVDRCNTEDWGDMVWITFDVPCNKVGKVKALTLQEYAKWAEASFMRLRPGAEFAELV